MPNGGGSSLARSLREVDELNKHLGSLRKKRDKLRKSLKELADEVCDADGEVYEEIIMGLSRKAGIRKACKKARKILGEKDGT